MTVALPASRNALGSFALATPPDGTGGATGAPGGEGPGLAGCGFWAVGAASFATVSGGMTSPGPAVILMQAGNRKAAAANSKCGQRWTVIRDPQGKHQTPRGAKRGAGVIPSGESRAKCLWSRRTVPWQTAQFA